MKKGTKAILITATVMILTGGIMSIICLAMGAVWEDRWTNRRSRTDYAEAQIQAVEEAEDLEEGYIVEDEWAGGAEPENDGDTRWWSWNGEEIFNLKLSVDVGELYVRSGDAFRVDVENPSGGFLCEVDGTTLVVDESGLPWDAILSDKRTIIWVTIPEGAEFEKVECKAGVGSITVEDRIEGDSVKIDVDAGSFFGEMVEALTKMDIDVDAGWAELSGSCMGRLSVDVDAGSATLQDFDGMASEFDVDAGGIVYTGTLRGDWKADCDVGSIELQLEGQAADYNYRVENDMGSVELDGRGFSALSDKSSVDNGAACTGHIDCDMGSVTVSFYSREQ